MADIVGPEQIEQRIREVSNHIARGVKVCSDLYREYLDAASLYDHDFAAAYLQHQGPAHEKRWAAELRTYRQRQDRDHAEVAYRHADRQSKALELELRALQSVGASVRAMYQVAGRGEH